MLAKNRPFFSLKEGRQNYDAVMNLKFSTSTEIFQVLYNFPIRTDIMTIASPKLQITFIAVKNKANLTYLIFR